VQGGRGGALGVGARGDVVGGAMQDLEDQHRGPLDVDGREGTVGDPSVQQLGDQGGRGTLGSLTGRDRAAGPCNTTSCRLPIQTWDARTPAPPRPWPATSRPARVRSGVP
jgi:hypothetical protein